MGDDEIFVLIVSSLLGSAALLRWYLPLARLNLLLGNTRRRTLLASVPILGFSGLYLVLLRWSDPLVRGSPEYLLLFVAAWALWLWVPLLLLPVLGISLRHDAIERSNTPAAVVCGSALGATTIIYAAANIGSGDTIWTTLEPAALGTAIMVSTWTLYRVFSPAWEDVAVGRDDAAGLRVGGFLLATSVVIATPLAGNWVSAAAMLNDVLRQAWPVLPMLAVAAFADHSFTPTIRRPRPAVAGAGVLAGALWIFIAVETAAMLR